MQVRIRLLAICLVCLACPSNSQTLEAEPRMKGRLAVAAAMRKVGRVDEAESMLRAWLDTHGDNLRFMEELGLTLAQQGKRKEAVEVYQMTIERFPNHKSLAGVYSNLGLAYEFSHQPTAADEAYHKAIETDPQLEAPRVNLGNFYRFVKKDYKKAAEQLEKARKINPKSYVNHFGLAAVYADQGKLTQAARSFEEAIKFTSDPTVAKTELAYVLYRQDKLRKAEDLFGKVLEGHPKFYRAHEGLARVYQSQHKMKKAEQQAKLAVKYRRDVGTMEVLADIYQKEKDMPHAHRWWRAVLESSPTDAAARHYLGLDAGAGGEASSQDDEVPGLDGVEPVSHDDFFLIIFLALGGGGIVVGVVAYSVHLRSQPKLPKADDWFDTSHEGVGLMDAEEDL
eukprot:TRINITY_DN13009_c0_g1_i1.p1 TRINITY_DN13009_c0_g1~~TRINITY_DN13009_c0_g1_i1.p1  ORF type:complete len:396 (+),score=87.80 TRINITY_DN13009_c0_g1_i1:118-1305(+)